MHFAEIHQRIAPRGLVRAEQSACFGYNEISDGEKRAGHGRPDTYLCGGRLQELVHGWGDSAHGTLARFSTPASITEWVTELSRNSRLASSFSRPAEPDQLVHSGKLARRATPSRRSRIYMDNRQPRRRSVRGHRNWLGRHVDLLPAQMLVEKRQHARRDVWPANAVSAADHANERHVDA